MAERKSITVDVEGSLRDLRSGRAVDFYQQMGLDIEETIKRLEGCQKAGLKTITLAALRKR